MRRVCTLKSRVIDALMFGALILSAAGLLCLLFLG